MKRAKRSLLIVELIVDAFIITVIFGALIASFILVIKTNSPDQSSDSAKIETKVSTLLS